MQHEQLLREAGFTLQADQVKQLEDRKRRLALAYEHHRYVSPEKIKAFRETLKQATQVKQGEYPHINIVHDTLKLTPIEQWNGQKEAQGVPPVEVLEKVREARARGVFDKFEVASIETTREYHDPIVFGRIAGCGDRFFIAEWGNDVSLRDLLGAHDG